MRDLKFRALRPNEVEVRAAQVSQKGASFLLYKDARVDQIILDETVGPLNWQRSHSRDNANCTVSIWDYEKLQWVSKEDTGTESNTEKEKGLASDSFKRACFNWGIGRELYTAPRIWIGPTVASAITGPIATCVFHLEMNGAAVSSGMGTCGLVGQIGVYTGWVSDVASGAKAAITPMDWIGLILISFVLPAILAPLINQVCVKLGWVKPGDMKLS